MNFLMGKTITAEYENWIVITVGILLFILIIFAITYYRKNKYVIDFWIMNTFYNWPIIGRSFKHKNDINVKDGWTAGEVKLCDDYYFEYNRMLGYNDNYYNMSRDYLKKADEVETTPIPLVKWIMLFLLVFGEAIIFSRLILEFVSEWSKNEADIIAYGMALVIAGLLVWLTDETGKEWYKNSKINKVRIWNQNNKSEDKKSILVPDYRIELQTSFDDDNSSRSEQLLNRLEKVNAKVKPTYWWTMITFSLIAFIAYSAFVQRATLNIDEIASTPMAAYATFTLFSLLFIFIQAFGIRVGYKHSFGSKQGKEAWEATKKYKTATEFYTPISVKKEYIKSQARVNLGKLQKRMKAKEIHHTNTFEDYLFNKNNKAKEMGAL